MIGDTSLFGLYLHSLVLLAIAAWLGLCGVRRALMLAGAYRWIWHPALFDMAVYVMLLFGLVRLSYFLQL
ncbi:DUF1656 domain-containing protein [Pseudomonas sp. NPDC090592]|uniref:DUF1656 domain-containing protein n=1 Tax=Pseudomonas sp. NPDC090592 TaxID=3364480 RepID=UPI00383A703D